MCEDEFRPLGLFKADGIWLTHKSHSFEI
jgi:hypothetical protein